MDACYLEIDGMKLRVDKVTAVYEMWTHGKLPFPIVTVRVISRVSGDYQAVPNVVVKRQSTAEWTCGIGGTVQEAVEDAIRHFWREVAIASRGKELEENDFVCTQKPACMSNAKILQRCVLALVHFAIAHAPYVFGKERRKPAMRTTAVAAIVTAAAT